MFSLHSNGGAPRSGQVAEAGAHELHQEPPTGPLHGELLDLYAAMLIVVPVALLLKALLF
jgi:hypothetical protein